MGYLVKVVMCSGDGQIVELGLGVTDSGSAVQWFLAFGVAVGLFFFDVLAFTLDRSGLDLQVQNSFLSEYTGISFVYSFSHDVPPRPKRHVHPTK